MSLGSDPDALFREYRRTGEPRKLGELYDAVAPELLGIAMHVTRDPSAAEDVLQQTFLAAIERAESFDQRRRVLPWLIGILAREARRERSRRRPEVAELERASSDDVGLAAERAELLERLDLAVAKLPEEFRPVLVLRLRHGLGATEIAAALGRPSGTVRSQMQRGLELLRRTLPAGLAGTLAALAASSARGLAAIRADVLDHAAAAQAAAFAGSAAAAGAELGSGATGGLGGGLGGALVAKKWIGIAAAVVATMGGWLAWSAVPGRPAETRERAGTELRAAPADPESAPVETATEATGQRREELAAAPTTQSDSAPRPPPGATALAVTVLAPDGETPVEGEPVLLWGPEGTLADSDPRVERTGNDGVARFEPLSPGYARVHLLRGGEGQTRIRAGEVSTLTLRVLEGVHVRGSVVDGAGAPVRGARIWLSERSSIRHGHVVAVSDGRGAFELPWVSRDQHLSALASGFAPTSPVRPRGIPGGEAEVRLVVEREGHVVRGRVVDASGAAIANARLLVGPEVPGHEHRADDGMYGYAAPPQRATTGSDGTFELDHVAPGPIEVQARSRGFAPYRQDLDLVTGPAVIELERGARLAGRVVSSNGAPVAFATLWCGEIGRFGSPMAHTGTDGRFELEDLPSGAARITVQHATAGTLVETVVLSPGETLERELVLGAQRRIFGRLLDRERKPLERWGILLTSDAAPDAFASTQTDARGEFSFTPASDGAYTLQAFGEGTEAWRRFPAHTRHGVEASDEPIEIVLGELDAETASLSARVLRPDGSAAGGAELTLWHTEQQRWCAYPVLDERGTVEVPLIPPGTLSIEIRHPDHPWERLGKRPVAAGERVDLGEIVLKPAGRIRATLRGLADERVAALEALVTEPRGPESGVARITGRELETSALAPGKHVLVLRGDHVATARIEVDVAEGVDRRLEIELEPAGLRPIQLELPAGSAPPGWVSCTLVDAAGKFVWSPSWQIRNTLRANVSAPPGTYRLRARTDSGLSADLELSILSLGVEPELRIPMR